MNFFEFTFLLVSAAVITFILMSLGEKVLRSLSSKMMHPVILLLSSLVFTYSVLLLINYLLSSSLQMSYFVLAGMIIVLNRYWLGHFSHANEEMKAFPMHGERFAK